MQPFELDKPQLLRVKVLHLKTNEYIFMYDIHHIISDGVSMNIFIQEAIELYNGSDLPQLKIQYKDFAVWQNKLLESEKMLEQKEYWINRFKGDIPKLNLPIDYSRLEVKDVNGDSITRIVDKELTEALKVLVNENNVTLYMVLLAAYNILLYKYSGQEDIVVGSPIAGRSHVDLENVMGIFINMLAMRNRPTADKTYLEFLNEVSENSLKAFENQDFQYEELVNSLKIKREQNMNPLFDVVFAMQNMEMKPISIDNLEFIPYKSDITIARFELTLFAEETDENEIILRFRYATSLFKESTIEKMMQHYIEILKQVVENKQLKLKEIEFSSDVLFGISDSEEIDIDFTF